MVEGMSACISPVTVFILLIDENYELKNLLAKLEKILTILSRAFFSLESGPLLSYYFKTL